MCVEFCCLSSGDEQRVEGWILVCRNRELIPQYHSYRRNLNSRFYDTKAEAVAVAAGVKSGCATCFFNPYDEVKKTQELREFYEKL